MTLKQDFILHLQNQYKGLANESLDTLVADNLISPFQIQLPQKILAQAQEAIAAIFKMRELPEYQNHYQAELAAKNLADPGNKSIMMSYDFHIDENHNLKLIEINTNAAFLILGYEMYRLHKKNLPVANFQPEQVRQDILHELKLQNKNISQPIVKIIDEKPQEQRLYIEFLVYRELFKSWNWQTSICDYSETLKNEKPDFVYNRYTDFYLDHAQSAELKNAFQTKQICLSPNPYEYFMLADKQRLIDWSHSEFLLKMNLSDREKQIIGSVVPQSLDFKTTSKEEIWSKRKSLFFKPKREFGSKKAYKGASVSRKIFEELCAEDCMAQEYVSAPEQTFTTPDGPQNFKFDLRCYAYRGQLQMVVARLYQGQVTNLRTPLGGFACVEFHD